MRYLQFHDQSWHVYFFFHLLGDAHRYNKESLMVGWLQPITPWWRSYGFLWDAHRTYRQHYDMLLRTSLNMVRIPDTFFMASKNIGKHLIFFIQWIQGIRHRHRRPNAWWSHRDSWWFFWLHKCFDPQNGVFFFSCFLHLFFGRLLWLRGYGYDTLLQGGAP